MAVSCRTKKYVRAGFNVFSTPIHNITFAAKMCRLFCPRCSALPPQEDSPDGTRDRCTATDGKTVINHCAADLRGEFSLSVVWLTSSHKLNKFLLEDFFSSPYSGRNPFFLALFTILKVLKSPKCRFDFPGLQLSKFSDSLYYSNHKDQGISTVSS